MKKLFFAVIAFVISLSANAINLKEGKSADFNSMKKEGVEMTPEEFIEKMKAEDMSWSRGGITYEEYLQTIADWNNLTGVWKLAGFNGPLTVPQVKYMIVNSKPALLTVPVGAMRVMGSDPKGGVGYFLNQYEMDVKFLTFKSNNGFRIPLVKWTCYNAVGGYAVSPEVVTVTKTVTKEEVHVRDSIVIREVPIEKVILKEVTVVNRVEERIGGCVDCYRQPVYCSGYNQPVATGFGFNLSLNFTKVQQQQAAPIIVQQPPVNITVINNNTNNNNNQQQQQQTTPVVLPGEVITPQPGGQPVDGNPVVINPGGTPVDPNPVVINPGGTPVDPNGTIINPNGTPVDPNGTATNPDGTPVDPLKGSNTNSARIASVSPVQAGSGKFGQQDQSAAKVIQTEKPITTVAPQQKSGKFGQVTSQSNSGAKIATTSPVQQTVVKNGKFGQTSQNAYVAPTNNQSARNVQPTYTNGSSAKYKNQSSYSPQPVYTNKPANVNYGNGSSRFSNNPSSMNNSGARMNTGPRPGSGKFK